MNNNELIEKSLKISVIEGTGAVVFGIITQGYIFTKIALEFGADEFLLSILLGIQLLSQIFQIMIPRILKTFNSRKGITVLFATVSRSLWIFFLVLPIFGLMNKSLFVIIVSASFICASMAGNAWTLWMKDLVPRQRMGSFFGMRNFILSIANLIFTFIYSSILNAWPNRQGIFFVIIIALTAGYFSTFFVSRQYEPKMEPVTKTIDFKKVFSDKNFRKFFIFGGFWNFTLLFSASFFSLYQLENLKVNFQFLGYLSIFAILVTMLFYFVWGRLADKIGHKNILRIGMGIASGTAFMWFFMSTQTMNTLLWVDSLISGIAWSAINLAIFTIPILVGGKEAINLVPVFGAVNGICGLFGSVVGGLVGKLVSPLTFSLGNLEMHGIQLIFLAGGIMRVISLILVSKVEVIGHTRLRTYLMNRVTMLTRKITRDMYEPMPNIHLEEEEKENLKKKPKSVQAKA